MAFKDALLYLPTYPDAASMELVDEAARLGAGVAASVALSAPQVRFRYSTNPLAETLLHIGELAKAIEKSSSEAAAQIAARFQEKAHGLGVYGGYEAAKGESYEFPDMAARLTRTRDLCIVPYGPNWSGRATAEAVAFSSGRPALIYRAGQVRGDFHPARILVAWDGGRAAARAVADALPLLKRAQVEIVTVAGDKPGAGPESAAALARHLSRHGVEARIAEIARGRLRVERAIAEHGANTAADLLVMGAFGTSSLREFVLGGVTDSILQAPPLPVLLAH